MYDPATEAKVRQAEGVSNVTTAQPVAFGQTYSQPSYAQPAYDQAPVYAQPHQPQQVFIQGSQVPANGGNYARRPAPYRWADSICDWPKNIFPSCWCACCFCYGIYIVAQMSEKVGMASFRSVLTGFAIVYVVAFILQLIIGGVIIWWLPMICAFFYAMSLRLHIVRKDHITECGENGTCGEFCCACWCWYCSVAQMARHVYGYTKVLDGDGNPEREDGYGPLQQV